MPAPDHIMREPRLILDLVDPLQFQEDFRASRVTDSTLPHQVNTVQVTVRVGPSSIHRKLNCSAVMVRALFSTHT